MREGRTNLAIADVGGAFLVVSQFTLYADVSRGRRPGFTRAAPAGAGGAADRSVRRPTPRLGSAGRNRTVRGRDGGRARQRWSVHARSSTPNGTSPETENDRTSIRRPYRRRKVRHRGDRWVCRAARPSTARWKAASAAATAIIDRGTPHGHHRYRGTLPSDGSVHACPALHPRHRRAGAGGVRQFRGRCRVPGRRLRGLDRCRRERVSKHGRVRELRRARGHARRQSWSTP